jgi:preprotein translocase SecE subunit
MARFGEGPEGRAARRERDLDEHPREGFFERMGTFVRDVRAELGRTSWPTALQVRNTTIITIIAVIFFAAYLYGVDQLFSFLLKQLASAFGAAA